ncbi:MAG: hypothetical protein H6878_03145 [Rhodobiaceae bacterium]|nr:hypothetical protein [Rhodobiaceae bacterium]MCC0015282.1 hypothetical protein [Rhodobiaceae bacterium]MCC0042478.1 hypothetical protein [Rhodobiaceae bacterium]MCC0053479.1 hypothetical protein [Rhodobiaceae bacterium]
MMRALKSIALLAMLAMLTVGQAAADGIFGDNFTFHRSAERAAGWTGPMCDNPTVMARVRSRFASTQSAYWESGLTMGALDAPREIAYRDWAPTITAIRSCRADTDLSDGRRVGVVYWVRSEQGFAGHGYGVEYCVLGDDPPFAFAPGCRELLPR